NQAPKQRHPTQHPPPIDSRAGPTDGVHISKLAELRDKAAAAGKFGDAISAEVSRGRALGYYIERRESGAAGAFQAKTTEEADKQLEETIARSLPSRRSSARRRSQRAEATEFPVYRVWRQARNESLSASALRQLSDLQVN